LQGDGRGDSKSGEAGEGVGGAVGGAESAIGEEAEEEDDGHGAEEAEFFSDVGEDEIGGGFGEVEEFLHALHEAAAGEATGADGDEGLVDVESCALWIEVGMDEGEHAGAAPGDPEEESGEWREGDGDGEGEVFPLHAGEEEHHGGDSGEDEGGAEVGLLNDQENKDDGDDGGAEQGVAPVVDGVEALGEEPGEEEDEDGLGDFRGLEREAAEKDPAMGVLGVAEEEDDDEQDGGEGERGEDEARGLVVFVVDGHEADHDEETGDGPGGLAGEEGVGIVEMLLCHDGGGGEDHGEAHDHEGEGGEEDPFVYAYAFGHFFADRDSIECDGRDSWYPRSQKRDRGHPVFGLGFMVSRCAVEKGRRGRRRTKVINWMNWRRWKSLGVLPELEAAPFGY